MTNKNNEQAAKTLKNKTEQKSKIPQHEIDSLARALLPAIQALFETEEGKKEFEEWKAARTKSIVKLLNNKNT